MDNRRQEYWNDCLDAVIEKQLEALPNWTWIAAADETQWLGTYEKLKTWLAKNSNKYPKQKMLATWLNHQREAWKARRLNENQKQKLETLPDWNQDEKVQRRESMIARKHEACASTLAAAEFQRAVGRMKCVMHRSWRTHRLVFGYGHIGLFLSGWVIYIYILG